MPEYIPSPIDWVREQIELSPTNLFQPILIGEINA